MKIAMIGHKRAPSRDGGVEVVVTELAPRLAAMGNEVVVYNRYSGGEKESGWEGVKTVEVASPRRSSLNALVYSIRAAFKASFGGFDVIHFHAEGPCAAILIARLFGKRTAATIHGLDWKQPKWGFFAKTYLKFGERTAAKHADELIVLSPVMRDYFRSVYGRECTLIPNGVVPLTRREPRLITEKFGLEKHKYLLFLARITPVKRLELLLEAFAEVKTDMKLAVAGSLDDPTPYVSGIIELAKKDERVVFTGFSSGELLEELYSNCFLYVLPSDSEGMPISLLEAISARARCLVSDIPEITGVAPDYIHRFKKGELSSLRNELYALVSDPAGRENNFGFSPSREQADADADAITAAHGWDEVAQKTFELYKKAAKRG